MSIRCHGGIGLCRLRVPRRHRRFSRRPRRQQAERIGGRGPRLCGVSGEHQARGGDELHGVVRQFHETHHGVVELLDPALVSADVVGRPTGAKCLTARGKFADQVGEIFIVWGTAGLGAQQGYGYR